MDGRKRTVQIKFRVTEAERDLILEKMKLIPTRNRLQIIKQGIGLLVIHYFLGHMNSHTSLYFVLNPKFQLAHSFKNTCRKLCRCLLFSLKMPGLPV